MSAPKSWELDVEVEKVIGCARPRITRYGTFVPKPTRQAENHIQEAWRKEFGDGPLIESGPVYLEVHTYRKLPKSRPKRVLSEPDTFKPDWDNVGKLVCDAISGLAFADDSQVTCASVIQHDRTRRESELIHIKVERL